MLTNKENTLKDNIKMLKTLANKIHTDGIMAQDEKTKGRMNTFASVTKVLEGQIRETFSSSSARSDLLVGISKIYNNTMAAIQLAGDQEYTKEEAKKYISTQRNRLPKVEKIVASLYEKKAKKELAKAEGKGSYSSQEAAAGRVLDIINQGGPVIQSMAEYKKMLPSSAGSKDSFIITRVPIVAITNPIVTKEEFEAGGFDAESIGNYCVLQDQLVVGINANLLKGEKKDPEKFRKWVIEHLEDKLKKKLVEVGSPIGFGASGFTYVWLIPEKEIDRFRSRNSKPLHPKEWGMAFKD
jgi:hypothetical protein